MQNQTTPGTKRKVQIHTSRGMVRGDLRVSPGLRTLDDLNLDARDFVTLHEPEVHAPGWEPGGHPLAVGKSTILFVSELSDFKPGGENRSGQYARSWMKLLVGDYSVQGFVHVPRDGDPLLRLNQQKRAFIALTSASVVGPNEELATAFLAVNRSHIAAAQRIDDEQPVLAVASSEVELEP